MEENQKQLEQVLKEVERAVANMQLDKDATPFRTLRNQMPWPAEGRLVRKYGSRSPDGIGSTGIVIQSAVNTPVKAIHHGRVVFSDWLRGFGLLMIVDHGDGFMSLYGFNQALLKDTGDWVNEGDVLASVGNSGGQREGGLYFEIRYKGKPDNPLLWLKKNS
jgi:septal ring factor EnvC (AmiA/AmiB activator)